MRERRVAIVTGASSGIGRALAERAVRAGWDVFAVGRRTDRLEALAASLGAAMGRIETLTLDLREPGAARRIVRAALERFGRLDVLVNCAGGTAVGRITEQNDEALYEQMETHVIVPLALTREALPSLRASRGLVIFFGSGVARIPVGTLGAYPPAKAAVRSMSRVARNELAADGIAVTYVDPGAVATEFMTRVGFAGPPAAIAASPYDVARAVFAAFATRAPVVNAVPWQTFFVALGEALPRLTDAILARAPGLVGGDPLLARGPETMVLPAGDIVDPDVADADVGALAPMDAIAVHGEADDAAVEGAEDDHLGADAIEAGTPTTDDVLETVDETSGEPPCESPDDALDDSIADSVRDEHGAVERRDDDSVDESVASTEPTHDVPSAPPVMTSDEASASDDAREAAHEPSTVQRLLVDAPPAHEAANAAVDLALAAAAESRAEPEPETFDEALEPHAARMKKLNLKTSFLRGLLVPDAELDLGYVAMRWAGMPNKNERGLTADVLEALARAGFLERVGTERFRVARAPEPDVVD